MQEPASIISIMNPLDLTAWRNDLQGVVLRVFSLSVISNFVVCPVYTQKFTSQVV